MQMISKTFLPPNAALFPKQEAKSVEATGGSPSSCPPGAGDLE